MMASADVSANMEAVYPSGLSTSSSLLHRLPAPLFTLIAQSLPLPDKLLHLTHVCRSLPALTPSSFAYDTVACTPALISKLSSSPPPPLLSLLSHVPYALYVDGRDDSLSTLCLLLNPPSAHSPFPVLRALTFAPTGAAFNMRVGYFPFPLTGLRLCPHLTVLHLNLHSFFQHGPSSFLSPLPLLSTLRSLRLSGHFVAGDFLLLLSLPLTSLDLHSAQIHLLIGPPSPFPSLPHLQSLLLPYLRNEAHGTPPLSSQWEQAILSSLSTPHEGEGVRLERLSTQGNHAEHLSYIPSLRRLHTLQLLPWSDKEHQLIDFYTALIASPLPLRHLRLEHEVVISSGPDAEFSRPFSVLPQFLSAYAGQLLTLDFQLNPFSAHAEGNFVMPARAAEVFTAALLSCHSLRRLHIKDCWLTASVPVPSAPAFPHLESLELHAVSATSAAILVFFLDAAPHLQELTLHLPRVNFSIISWIASRCPELRTLSMRVVSVDIPLDAGFVDDTGPQPLPPSAALPHLTSLICHTVPVLPEGWDRRIALLTNVVSRLVRVAPALRYLCMPFEEWRDDFRRPLSLLAGLTQLRGLSVAQDRWMSKELQDKFFVTEKTARVQRDGWEADSIWGDEVCPRPTLPWADMRRFERMRGGAMREVGVLETLTRTGGVVWMFREEVDGMTGAAAFFAALKAETNAVETMPAVEAGQGS